jgi:hypothetical protein
MRLTCIPGNSETAANRCDWNERNFRICAGCMFPSRRLRLGATGGGRGGRCGGRLPHEHTLRPEGEARRSEEDPVGGTVKETVRETQ